VASIAWVRRRTQATRVLGDVQRDLSMMSPEDFRERYDFDDE
jgi:hypothetical protein